MSTARLAVCAAALALILNPLPVNAGAADLVPHKAIYDMRMVSSKNGSTITDVEGEMTYAWADACDGWTMEQKLALKFYPADGQQTERVSTLNSWEAKDGKTYRFSSRTVTDGSETQSQRGSAFVGLMGGEAKFTVPADAKPIPMKNDTLFPTSHTAELLDTARHGEKLLNRVVFDGADEQGQVEINAFIGDSVKTDGLKKINADVKERALVEGKVWPIRLAFFDLESGVTEPEYEMQLKIMDNGIAREMLIDFGDFVLSGTLKKLEKLTKPAC